MKKTFRRNNRWIKTTSLLFAFYSFIFSPAGAQVRFGAKGGFLLTQIDFNKDDLKDSNRAGFFIGPTVKFVLPVAGLGVDVSALYEQRDLKVQECTFHQKSLLVQGDARYSLGLGETLAIFAQAGPQFSFNVGEDIMQWAKNQGDNNQFSLQETMLSVNMGLGVTFARHFEGAIRYNIPISKTADFTWSTLGDQLSDQTWHHAKTRTNAWTVSVTYFF